MGRSITIKTEDDKILTVEYKGLLEPMDICTINSDANEIEMLCTNKIVNELVSAIVNGVGMVLKEKLKSQ